MIGLRYKLAAVEEHIAHLRRQLGIERGPQGGATPAKRVMSAAARRRIALAQKKRWAAYNAQKAAGAKPKAAPAAPKRELSAEGRARIAAAMKKRWAAFRKAKKAPAAKTTARKSAPKAAPQAKAASPSAAAPVEEAAAPATQ